MVSVTHAFRDNLISRGISGDKIKVVTNGVDPSKFAPAPRDTALADELGLIGKTVIGYVGTHGMAHALDKVLDAAELLKHRSDIAFLFVGGGAQRQALEARGQTMANVHFLGSQPRERMASIWSICDVALVPLRDTPTFATVIPSKIFEAMAMGLPILMSLPDGEATGIVSNSDAGLTVSPENPELMKSAILRLADEPELRQRLGKNGISAVQQYDRAVLAKHMLDHLTAAIGKE